MEVVHGEETPGLTIPAAWYFWPAEADAVYQARLERWRRSHVDAVARPIPRRHVTCIVFLQDNMPPELQGCSPDELTAAGVYSVPGEAALEFILGRYEADHGVRLEETEVDAYLRGYLSAIGAPIDPSQDGVQGQE